MTQQSVLEETGLYLQYSNFGGLGALLSHETQHFPCSPKGYKPKPSPGVPHFLYEVSCTVSSLSGRYQICHPHTAALSFRIWGTLSSAFICHATLGHGGVQERHKSRESRQSLGLQGSRSESRQEEPQWLQCLLEQAQSEQQDGFFLTPPGCTAWS